MKKKKQDLREMEQRKARAEKFFSLIHDGFQSVVAGDQMLEEWLTAIEPLAQTHRARLVVVMWPKGTGIPSDPIMEATRQVDGWLADFDFVFDEPPYSVSVRRQPGPPEWLSNLENLGDEWPGMEELDRLEDEASEPKHFLSAELGRAFEAYQDHGDWDEFLRFAESTCVKYSGSAAMLFTPDRKTISMLVSAGQADEAPATAKIDFPNEGYQHIKTIMCETEDEFRALVEEMRPRRDEAD